MTPRRKAPRPGKKAIPTRVSDREHDAMILYEKSQSDTRVVLEAVQGCLRRTEFEEFRQTEFQDFRTEFQNFRGVVNDRFTQIDHRFEQIDHRFEQIDDRFEQIDHRFEQINEHLALVVGELRGLRKDVAGHAQASELRALDQRVTALERRAGS
jgi:archaellum component FlaC